MSSGMVLHSKPLARHPASPMQNATAQLAAHFKQYFPTEWREYIGDQAYKDATSFHRWVSLKAQATVPYGNFDPVTDKMLTKRKR